jgi:tetratricopeptide (TPR) repeat protein
MQGPSIHSAYRKLGNTIVVVLCILFARPVFAEWYKDYEAAMELMEKGQNAAAIPKLQSAIQQKNQEGANIKFYGMKFSDYFPHFYLGMAYNSQGNYTGAVQEFETSEQQGSIQKKKQLFDRLSTTKTLAKANLAVKEPTIAKNIPPTNIPITKPEETKPEPPVTTTPEKPEEKPTQKPEEKPAQKPAEPTVTELKPTVAPEKKPEEKVATLTPPEKKPPVVVPPITAELDPNSDVRKRYLQNGARKYFEGDYDAAILFLEEVRKLSPADKPVNFLLGCSYASKYLLNGSQNKQLLDSASMMFRQVKKGTPKYQPKSKTFLSPAVLEIYEKTT